MANEKYALLDTDFISKMHLIRKDDRNKLIDKIMAMPNYTFYCHDQINALHVGRTEFLEKLTLDCEAIGAGKNLGELKSYVLLQVLNMKFGQRVYVFCSDDKNARNGVVAIGGASCISVLSSFVRLQKEIHFSREDAEPYIKSYMSCCLGKNQTTFRIQDTSKERRMRKVPCEQVFDEIFAGKIDEMRTGNLKYI